MPKGKYRTARNVGFSSERLAPCIYRILAARAYFHGSSPRMWGTHRLQQHADAVLRFIPTHVGNTCLRGTAPAPHPVHPHACGEHTWLFPPSNPTCGSSPRMWGTRVYPGAGAVPRRFIPTHVGNTPGKRRRCSLPPVHPHACGEHGSGGSAPVTPCGSSPRMWGTRARLCRRHPLARFIPTHVGNTAFWVSSVARISVHPHACGEHLVPTRRRPLHDGSSPRMWGTPPGPWPRPHRHRFIPTHVGNTAASILFESPDTVHPHACGEHTYRTELFLKKKKHLEKSTASSSIPWSDPEAGMPPIAARRTTLDVDG